MHSSNETSSLTLAAQLLDGVKKRNAENVLALLYLAFHLAEGMELLVKERINHRHSHRHIQNTPLDRRERKHFEFIKFEYKDLYNKFSSQTLNMSRIKNVSQFF